MLALEWLKNAHGIMEKLEATQLENIKKAATAMADSIEAGRWVHTFADGRCKKGYLFLLSIPHHLLILL